MISNPCLEVQTTSENRPSVPAWFGSRGDHSSPLGNNRSFGNLCPSLVRLGRGRFGTYEPLDFLALRLRYAISGERTLCDFFEGVAPFETAFMALFGRRCLPHRSSLSRFLAAGDRPCARFVSCALPEVCSCRRVDVGDPWWSVGPTRASLHCL